MHGFEGKVRSAFLVSFMLCLSVFFAGSMAAGSAITVPYEARAMIEAAQAELDEKRRLEEEEKYRAEADQYVASTAEEVAQAEAELEEARKVLEAAETEARLAEEARKIAEKKAGHMSKEADILAQRAQELFAQAAAAAGRADSLSGAAQKRDAKVLEFLEEEQRARVKAEAEEKRLFPEPAEEKRTSYSDELRSAEEEQRSQEQAMRRAEEARRSQPPTPPVVLRRLPEGGNWGAVRSAYARAAYLERAAVRLDEESERAQELADEAEAEAEEAASQAEDAEFIRQDAVDALQEYESYLREARKYAEQTWLDRESLLAQLDAPQAARYMSTGVRYHTWSDGNERSGYQTALPIVYGKWTPDFSYGLSTYYIFSDYLDTLTDTWVYMTKRDQRKKFTLDYSLSFNVPTGKSALGWRERHARVTEDLVTVEQFGKGWQVVPGIAVTWRTSEEETWTVGTSYIFSQSYDPTSDIPNDDISPGGEWGKYVRYVNARDKWQLVVELAGSTFGKTKNQDGSSYTEKDSWDLRTAYNRKINEKQDIMFYYFLERQGSNYLPFPTDSPNVHYFGTMWKNKLNEKSDMRLAFDVMTTSGNRDLRMYSYYDDEGRPGYGIENVDGRTKYTIGAGYDLRVDDKSKLALDVEYFRMEDGVSTLGYPATTYNGWNVYLSYFATF